MRWTRWASSPPPMAYTAWHLADGDLAVCGQQFPNVMVQTWGGDGVPPRGGICDACKGRL